MKTLKTELVKHTVFDAYGTLFDVHSAASRFQSKLGEQAQDVSNLWRKKQLEYTWLRSLMQHYVDFWQITQDALDYALETYKISDTGLRQDLINAYYELECYSEVIGVLKNLKEKGLSTSILSNGSPSMLAAGIKNSKMEEIMDSVFSVDDLKKYKPDPSVYQMVTDGWNCKPENVLFFSSNAWDVSGSAAFGFQSVWVNRFGQAAERIPGIPVLEIQTLDEVLKYFK